MTSQFFLKKQLKFLTVSLHFQHTCDTEEELYVIHIAEDQGYTYIRKKYPKIWGNIRKYQKQSETITKIKRSEIYN